MEQIIEEQILEIATDLACQSEVNENEVVETKEEVVSNPIESTTLTGRTYTMDHSDEAAIGRFYRTIYCRRVWGYNPSWLYGEVPVFSNQAIREQFSANTVYRLEAFESLDMMRWVLEQVIANPEITSDQLGEAYRALESNRVVEIDQVQSVTEALVGMHQFFTDNLDQLIAAIPVMMEGVGQDLGDWSSFLGLWLNLFQERGDLNTIIRVAGAVRDFVDRIHPTVARDLEGAELNDRFYSICLVNLEPNAVCEFLNQLPPHQLLRGEYAHQLADSFMTIPWIQKFWTEQAGSQIIANALSLHWQENNHQVFHPSAYDMGMLSAIMQHFPNIVDRNLYPRYNRDHVSEMVASLLYLAAHDDPSEFTEEETTMVTNLIARAQSTPRTRATDAIGGFRSGDFFEQYLELIRVHNPALFQHYQYDQVRNYGLYTPK